MTILLVYNILLNVTGKKLLRTQTLVPAELCFKSSAIYSVKQHNKVVVGRTDHLSHCMKGLKGLITCLIA